jgi:hypothetical protein
VLRQVAVKTIDKRRWKADDVCGGLYAIKQEAQALKELTAHPNIIGFIDGASSVLLFFQPSSSPKFTSLMFMLLQLWKRTTTTIS